MRVSSVVGTTPPRGLCRLKRGAEDGVDYEKEEAESLDYVKARQ
jgi:hypothetical protein